MQVKERSPFGRLPTTRRDFLADVMGCAVGASCLSVAGCRQAPSAPFSLWAFKYGQSTLSEHLVYRNGSRSRRVPISFLFYMVETGGRRILVDAGCETMPGFKMEHFIRPVALLERFGCSPADITDVVVTHAHHDHIDGVRHFRTATVSIQKDEARAGAKYLKGLRVRTFDESACVADLLEVRRIGGHSVGSSIVLLPFGERQIVLAGDECYVRGCLERKIPTGASRDPRKSEAFVRTYSASRYDVHLYHDSSTLPGRHGAQKIV